MVNISHNAPTLPGRTALHSKSTSQSANPYGGEPGLVFSEIAHLGKINLRGDKSLRNAVKSLTGCAFPPAANKFNSAGERHVIWLSPNEFLIICEAGKDEELASSFDAVLQNQHFAVTNITDALSAFHLKGVAVRQVLAKGCSLDLHPKNFCVGDCAQSLLSHAAITILAISDNDFIIICRTSFASYLHDWLYDAALEYGVKFTK